MGREVKRNVNILQKGKASQALFRVTVSNPYPGATQPADEVKFPAVGRKGGNAGIKRSGPQPTPAPKYLGKGRTGLGMEKIYAVKMPVPGE